MYYAPFLALKYLRYYLLASNGKGHGTHSPFIYNFITRVLNDKSQYTEYKKAEGLRRRLLNDSRMFIIEDFGAGSAVLKRHERSIKSIARNAAKSKKFGQLLFRMVKYYQPTTILELGTSLGITTSYLSLANPVSKIVTMEGAKEIAEIAKLNFRQLAINNVELIEGNFDNTLPHVLDSTSPVDFAFIDGNHRRIPTENYFQMLLPHLHNDSILVFDDIHWSKGMEKAWETIKAHPEVRCSIDLFFIGIVVFRKEFREKQHFAIRF
ncbi:MAG: class I SAM-dependent methyltransferase [Chitinophagaceae bacterium]|nr:class I SAM-dependent methyltransferase [Chitinophagaceae bacterium]